VILPYQVLADGVLVVHLVVVLFVVLGLPAIVIGNRLQWPWVNAPGWRMAHLLAIGVVALQAWLGHYCPLTYLETWLREQAGETGYQASFMQHWIEHLIYHHAPLWVFALTYTAFGLLVAWAWWRYPPRRHL
jgi:hypothetical protein